MMGMKLGKAIFGFGKIPAGSDSDSLWYVFTAGDKPVYICNGSHWGGDSSEWISIYMIPPSVQVGGANDPSNVGGDEKNAINVFDQIKNTANTATNKRSMFNYYGGYGGNIILPPNHSLAIASTTANSVAWKVVLQGYELVD